ncbi:MAG: glycosyltransferase family 4 protein, partial [Candidatus Marinimicrobia bacterium]|nr:glycosyltransferase family 4 protein [Candidatus Neomarinimicrobiota bacterium]
CELAAHLRPPPGGQVRFGCLNGRNRPLPPALAQPGAPPTCQVRLPGRYVQRAWRAIHWPPYDLLAGPADVFHFPNFIAPPLRRGRLVVSMHDASFLRYPETTEAANLRYLQRHAPSTVARADAIITISRFSAAELSALLNVPPAKLQVVHPGLSPQWAPAPPEAVSALCQRLRLPQPYLLTVGTIEPRKNLAWFLEVFERLERPDVCWVLAGRPGWKSEAFLRRLGDSPARDRIRLLLNVAETDLAPLYTGAALFVFPTLYEGFGFPPLEALACGTPVAASPVACLPEVLGDAVHWLPTHAPDAWRTRLRELLDDPAACRTHTAAGHTQAQRYTWARAAAETWDVYRQVHAS